MVSGGSGITPFISVIREFLFRATRAPGKSPSILLVCTFKKSLDLEMLDLILPVSGTNFDISSLQLQIEAYVTREKQPPTENSKIPKTIWFKPDALDVPVSAILGQNNWLWLAVIVSASCIIFLLLIGVLTRYYIYPIDHNSNLTYSFSSKSALNMLFVCISIATTATMVFLWNKKQNANETRQIQNVNTSSPMNTPPSAWFCDAERELESLPRQSLVQATTIHYGTRPDLKSKSFLKPKVTLLAKDSFCSNKFLKNANTAGILSECKSSSVGVLVSGPRKMRQEVAAICSPGLANNLHFHSSSFSW